MLYRFEIEVSDIDRGLYESLDFRVAQHPSENVPYLLSRTLAYALNCQRNLEFTPGGLNDPDAPALRAMGEHGQIELWIEIGNPSARRLHRASKAAKQVIIYTYKSAEVLIAEMQTENIHRAKDIQIYAFDQKFLQSLESKLEKTNKWWLVIQEGQLSVEANGESFTSELKPFKV